MVCTCSVRVRAATRFRGVTRESVLPTTSPLYFFLILNMGVILLQVGASADEASARRGLNFYTNSDLVWALQMAFYAKCATCFPPRLLPFRFWNLSTK